MQPRDLLIALNARPDLGRDAICRLAAATDLWAEAGTATADRASEIGIRVATLEKALRARDGATGAAGREIGIARELGIDIVTRSDHDYPQSLFDLELPPPVLYLHGRLPTRPRFAIVGSRAADVYGRHAAERFAAALARAGLCIVSGLAFGIDSYAHRAALSVDDAESVAVLGSGVDVPGPRTSRHLRDRLSERGAVVSEFPLGARALPRNFPIRNRIIAALSVASLVVQAAPRSGSLITARLTMELGRDLYAVPGKIFDRLAKGTNALIRDGAFPVADPEDILDTLPLAVKERLMVTGDSREGAEGEGTSPATSERMIGAFQDGQSYSVDDLAMGVGEPVEKVQAQLLELELEGWVQREPGGRYSKRQR